MKSLIKFLETVFDDVEDYFHISTSLDRKTVKTRVEAEGLSFLTITLPQFSADFERSMAEGYVGPDRFLGFSKSGKTPDFLGGLLDIVFDRYTGRLVNDVFALTRDVPDAIRAIRQITLMFGKVRIECSEKRTKDAIQAFINCERDLTSVEDWLTESSLFDFSYVSSLLFREMNTRLDAKAYNGEFIPKHGPGATADKLKGNRKFEQSEWPNRLEEWFSWSEYLYPSYTLALIYEDEVRFLEPGMERPVKVTPVPKTLKAPRIIAIEPTCMQYVQQGILESMVELIEEDDILSQLMSVLDQTPNQRMAREGSITGDLATLDLSEASDRVSNRLVKALYKRWPSIAGAIQACRSTTADVPGHGIISLSKFASMGSALCFPVEAMVFLTIVFMGIQDVLNRPLTRSDIKHQIGKVRVYGDDIIVPVEFVNAVIARLEAFGLKVNVRKSFTEGYFRESCGKEYWQGVDVSIVRVREVFPTSRQHVTELVSTVSLRNQLYWANYPKAVEFLDQLITGFIPFPIGEETSPGLVRHSTDPVIVGRWDDELQRPLIKAAVIQAKLPASRLDGAPALMKFFLKRGDLPIFDEKHLQRAGRPVSLQLKIRWIPSV